ncbi:hypothetical protein HYT01_01005 [Candidatus Giovannonibacteria bacterium]|nr:hypothetical protein [Candidatus Giovannonibacteria bacterium]
MEHSQAELLRKLSKIYDEPELISIVNLCGTPSLAEEIAERLEYPTSLLRETRYAGILKKDFPEIYAKTVQKIMPLCFNMNKKDRTKTKHFSCNWTSREKTNEFELAGTMLITPHAFLPPVFWDYELFFEKNNELVFSSKTAIPAHKRTDVRCIFTEGSRSIPVGLLLVCNKHSNEFTFRRTIKDDETYWWSRTNPVGNRLTLGLKGEIFGAGIEKKSYNNVHRQVTLRTLGDTEKKLLEPWDTTYLPRCVIYHLVLEEQLWYPDGQGGSLRYSLEMRYKPHADNLQEKKDTLASRVIFHMPFNHYAYNTGPDYKILTSVFQIDRAPEPTSNREKFADRVAKMLKGTPEQIEFLPTLQNFFSFKRNSDFFEIYNEGAHWDPLVLPKTKEAKAE